MMCHLPTTAHTGMALTSNVPMSMVIIYMILSYSSHPTYILASNIQPWTYCILGGSSDSLSIVCDRKPNHEVYLSFFEYWRLHPEDITNVTINCHTSPDKSCFCVKLPSNWYEDLLCHPEKFVPEPCEDTALIQHILTNMPNLMSLNLIGLDLRKQTSDTLDHLDQLTNLRLVDTQLEKHQLPNFCHFHGLHCVVLSGISLWTVSAVYIICSLQESPELYGYSSFSLPFTS